METCIVEPLLTPVTLQHLQVPARSKDTESSNCTHVCIRRFWKTCTCGTFYNQLLVSNMCYSLSWASTVAVTLLDVGLVALVPHQFFQGIGEGEVQLHVLLLLWLQEAISRCPPPVSTPSLYTTQTKRHVYPKIKPCTHIYANNDSHKTAICQVNKHSIKSCTLGIEVSSHSEHSHLSSESMTEASMMGEWHNWW